MLCIENYECFFVFKNTLSLFKRDAIFCQINL